MVSKKSRSEVRVNKHRKLRNRFSGTAERPRLAVFRSNNHMYAQIIDDTVGNTLVSASTLQKEVKAELEAYGFTNIALVERKDLMMGLLTKAGAIEEISIEGKADFKKNTKYRSDARVVIIYHTFRGQS